MQCASSHKFLAKELRNNEESDQIANIIDQKLGNIFTTGGMEGYIQLIPRCVEGSSERRTSMNYVVMELDRILKKEMSLTTMLGGGSRTVTLGTRSDTEKRDEYLTTMLGGGARTVTLGSKTKRVLNASHINDDICEIFLCLLKFKLR